MRLSNPVNRRVCSVVAFAMILFVLICSAGALAAMSRAEKDTIAQMVVEAMTDHCYRAVIVGDEIELDWPSGGGAGIRMSLDRLILTCEAYSQEMWEEIVRDYVDATIAALEESAAIREIIGDYSAIASRLTVSLFPAEYLDYVEDTDGWIFRRDIDGLITCLTMDLVYSVRNVTRGDAEKWGICDDELLQAALENTFRRYPVEVVPVDMGYGVTLLVAEEENTFASTYALDLARIPGAIGAHGCLFILPEQSTIILYPVRERDKNLTAVMRMLADYASGPVTASPNALCSRLFWYDGARYIEILCGRLSGRIVLYMLAEFNKVVTAVER